MMHFKLAVWSIMMSAALLLSACASPVDRGLAAYNAGRYEEALAYWLPAARQGDMYAQNNMGLLFERGVGGVPRNLNSAADWFFAAARQGLVLAMINLAKIQTQLGNHEPAVSWFTLAARWGDAGAAAELAKIGKPVPQADLLLASQQSAAIAQAQAAQAAMGLAAGYGLGCAIAGGCGTQTQTQAPPPNYLCQTDSFGTTRCRPH